MPNTPKNSTKPLIEQELGQWQQEFSQSLFGELSPELRNNLSHVSEEAAQQRFSIYQNNVFYSLTTALADLYPVIKKLVGEDFFNGLASYYLRQHPPQQAAMVHFGQNFSHFLQHFEHTQSMLYLSDIAKLELARHHSYHATDTLPLSEETIQTIDPERLATATLEFHPSVELVISQYPIFSIWQANQEGHIEEKNISLDEQETILVVRPYYELILFSIGASNATFIQALLQQQTVEAAIALTTEAHGEFDISHNIQFLLQQQLLTAIHYNN